MALLVAMITSLSGCAWWNNKLAIMRQGQGDPAFASRVPCRVPPHATAEELVDYLNANVHQVHAWRASKVRLRANNMPLTADIAVERERHLRIVVNSVAGNELDLGCNDDVFWFWAKRNPQPAVLYASHEQMDLVRETLQIPFQPDWLMEALGVATIPLEGTTLEPVGPHTSRLISQHTGSNGRKMRKAITVDTCHGRVLEHSIWDESGRRIAHAEFSKHQRDPATGAILAHYIKIEWPQADITLAMDLGNVDINPAGMPQKIWDMPHMPGYPVLNLEDIAMRRGRPRTSQTRHEADETRGAPDDLWQARREFDDEESVEMDAEELQ